MITAYIIYLPNKQEEYWNKLYFFLTLIEFHYTFARRKLDFLSRATKKRFTKQLDAD